MRILFGMLVFCGLVALSGCGTPEAEFAWSNPTQELIPAAQKTAKEFVLARFGTPAKMVAWQRLPIRFGGMPGEITGVVPSEEYENIITALQVDFRVPAMMAKYDENLDGLLAFSEFPAELQTAITIKKFEAADADKDGFLTPAELGKIGNVKSELFVAGTVSQVTTENAKELIGKELLFVNGSYAEKNTKVKSISVTDDSVQVEIWPPLNVEVKDGESAVELAGNQVMLDFGSTMRSGRHLYMKHCMHCHGVTGDGNGPTAKYLNPLPRDYRQGKFKFISTPAATVIHPSRDDLTRILRNGIPGTYMPSFSQLKDTEAQEIIEYVRWLSMRGQYEGRLNVLLSEYTQKAVADAIQRRVDNAGPDQTTSASAERQKIEKKLADYLAEDLPLEIDDETNRFTKAWREAELASNVITPKAPKPPSSPESIARGRHLYLSKCAICHGVTGEGNGENTRGYQKDPVTQLEYPAPGLFDVWGQPIKPRNLNTGIYRGGRRPLDLYRRIHEGIPPSGMLSFATFKDEQIWDVVDYVMSIPIQGPIPPQSASVAQARKPEPTKVAQSKDSAPDNAE